MTRRQEPRPTAAHATVSTAAITHNTRFLAQHTGVQVMAVVKADGYGHGAAQVARAALAGGATWLGVTSLSEALDLRLSGLQAPILSWLNPIEIPVEVAARARVDLAVASMAQLRWCASGVASPMPVRVHLHVDTGLARDGAPLAQWPQLCAAAARMERSGLITVVGVMSHMADADSPADPGNAAARSHFDQAVRTARRAGLRPAHRHLAATSAAITDPAARHTMVRIGAGLVGIDLSGASEGALIPSMTVTAPVLMVRSVRAGQAVGYGGRWRAPVESRLASVQAGYADGVPRIAEGKAQVLIGAVRCPIVGRVSMDQVVVDVSRAAVQPGDTATLWGPGDRGEPTVADWAQWAGTIPHEIVTGLGDRVQRRIDRTAASAWGVKR